ncbi:MaoC family dehydratase [Oxalobacteraceae bacterium]|nr:MaoC family dehydratase [Oxalobacteraceae bacterium]
MRELATLDAMRELVGQELATTDWIEITQERVNQFADATNDHQWIHLDAERAARESPFGGTIAHGFLTLSLVSGMLESAIRMVDMKMGINYGLNKVRFPAPVPVGSRVRARLTLQKIEDIVDGAQLEWSVVIEREGSLKPVCVAEFVMRRY